MTRTTRASLFVVGLCAATGSADAQRAAADSIPRELAIALLQLPGSAPYDLRVARAPDGFPAELIPRNGEVIGTAIRGAFTQFAVGVPLSVATALDTARSRLEGTGWTGANSLNAGRARRGFVSPVGSGTTNSFCRGNTGISISTVPRRSSDPAVLSSGAVLLFDIANGNASGCERMVPRSLAADNALIPVLNPPPSNRHADNDWSGGSGAFETHARLSTQLSAIDVRRHYAAQLIAAGWVAVDSSSSPGFASQAFRFSEPRGPLWIGLLNVLSPSGGPTLLLLSGRPR